MRKALLLFFILSAGIKLFAQNESAINVGSGLSLIVTPPANSARSHNISGYHFLIEKPIVFNKEKSVFLSLHPGLKYEVLGEYYETSGLGRWYSYNHLLQAAFIQSKLVFNSRFKSGEIFYTGASLGTYFWSVLKDRKNSDREISESRRSKLMRASIGVVLGVGARKMGRLRPAMEFKYYPNYGMFGNVRKEALNVSLIVGFGTKKELPE